MRPAEVPVRQIAVPTFANRKSGERRLRTRWQRLVSSTPGIGLRCLFGSPGLVAGSLTDNKLVNLLLMRWRAGNSGTMGADLSLLLLSEVMAVLPVLVLEATGDDPLRGLAMVTDGLMCSCLRRGLGGECW